jgi:hypothetical protein
MSGRPGRRPGSDVRHEMIADPGHLAALDGMLLETGAGGDA